MNIPTIALLAVGAAVAYDASRARRYGSADWLLLAGGAALLYWVSTEQSRATQLPSPPA